MRVGEDLIFNLDILSRGGRAYYVDDPLYVYAMPVGQISRAASPYSRSTADTQPLKAALVELWQSIEGLLSPAENEAFAERLQSLTREARSPPFIAPGRNPIIWKWHGCLQHGRRCGKKSASG